MPFVTRRDLLASMALGAALLFVQTPPRAEQRFPDVVSAKVRASGSSSFDFDVTVSSPYDTPQRYADGFRVTTPRHVGKVLIQARDRKYGYGGKAIEVALPARSR